MNDSSTPVRPQKSTARGGEGILANGLSSVGSTASNLYYRAPDLGISGAANNAYQRVPDLGVGATVSSVLGTSDRKQPTQFDEQEDDRVLRKASPSSSPKQENHQTDNLTPRQVSERAGPSDESRVGKSQQEIGTETGIPTNAGLGTTASADKSNLKALEKADSQGKIHQAHVPEDYEPVWTGSSSDQTGNRKTSSPILGSNSRSSHDRGRNNNSKTASSSRKSSQHGHYTPPLASDGTPLEMEKRRSIGGRIKDQVKGEIKILAGTVTGSDDKILKGLAIKHGDPA